MKLSIAMLATLAIAAAAPGLVGGTHTAVEIQPWHECGISGNYVLLTDGMPVGVYTQTTAAGFCIIVAAAVPASSCYVNVSGFRVSCPGVPFLLP